MRRLERLHAITNHLRARSPRTVPAAELAERFGVSTRTIERDLHALDQAGVPIYGVTGRLGGYTILPTHSLPPLPLTAQEAIACLTALALLDDSPFRAAARTARDKVAASLPAPLQDAIGSTDVRAVVGNPSGATATWLDAVEGHTLVAIQYDGNRSDRLVEPYTTLYAEGRWYLIGWCRTRDAVRGFRTDKIDQITPTSQAFTSSHATQILRDLERWTTARLT